MNAKGVTDPSCAIAYSDKQMQRDSEAVRREYDRLASGYDRRWRSYVDVTLDAVLASLELQGHERLLDVACGTGELERLLLARWPALQIVGTDISEGMLRQASAKKLAATWVRAEAARLPFTNDLFDHAVCANSFHYFREPRRALLEIGRVLRPRGRFVLVDWSDDYLSCRLCNIWLRLTDPAYCGTYTVRSCRSLLEESGFEVLHAEHFRVRWMWGMMRLVCRALRNTSG